MESPIRSLLYTARAYTNRADVPYQTGSYEACSGPIQRNNPRAVRMSTDIKEAVAASIVAQDERSISYERRGHYRETMADTDERTVTSKFDISDGFV